MGWRKYNRQTRRHPSSTASAPELQGGLRRRTRGARALELQRHFARTSVQRNQLDVAAILHQVRAHRIEHLYYPPLSQLSRDVARAATDSRRACFLHPLGTYALFSYLLNVLTRQLRVRRQVSHRRLSRLERALDLRERIGQVTRGQKAHALSDGPIRARTLSTFTLKGNLFVGPCFYLTHPNRAALHTTVFCAATIAAPERAAPAVEANPPRG